MARCRLWEATGTSSSDYADVERWRDHLARCGDCSERAPLTVAERRDLDLSVPNTDDMTFRRLRRRLLETLTKATPLQGAGVRWDGIARPGTRHGRNKWLAGAGLGAVIFSALALMVSVRGANQPADPLALVFPEPGNINTRWTRHREGDSEVVGLDEGIFWVLVKAHSSAQNLTFVLPDGEIMDLGTTFRVAVRSGRTREVVVESGRVKMNLRDASPVVLLAGMSWSRSPESGDTPPTAEIQKSDMRADPRSRSSPPHVPVVLSPLRNSASMIRHRIGAASHAPASSLQGEDQAYLRVLRLFRTQHLFEATSAAADYVRHFPKGFRISEMRQLAKMAAWQD